MKMFMNDGSVEEVETDFDVSDWKGLIRARTSNHLNGSAGFLHDVEVKGKSGRTFSLSDVRSVE